MPLGDPDGIRRAARALRQVVAALRSAATRLREGERDDVSFAVDTVRQLARQAAFDLDAAAWRHDEAADALDAYAGALEIRHRQAAACRDRRNRLGIELDEARHRIGRLESSRAAAVADPWQDAVVGEEIVIEVERLDALRARRDAVDAELRDADRALERAADQAILRLDSLAWHDQAAAGQAWAGGFSAGAVAVGAAAALFAATPLGLPALAALAGTVAGAVRSRIDAEVRAPTPVVTATEAPRVGQPRRPAEALREAVEVDRLGRGERTVVKITAIESPDGVARWRVALPSTQDWGWASRDGGAVNDLDANLALTFAPHERTQYERGVLDAMRQAGIGREDPVLLVGFSQGGIMAGHLAATRPEHRWAGIIVAGAPVDALPVPAGTQVVAVEHLGDPVPRLERDLGRLEALPDRRGWSTIRTISAGSVDGLPGIHSASQYDATLRRHGVELDARHPELAAFYAPDGRTVTRHYTWREGGG